MSTPISKQILFILVIFNFLNINGQEINMRHPKYEKINLNFENDCKKDTLEKIYHLKSSNRKYYISNFKNNGYNIECYFNDKKVNISSSEKIRLKKHSFFKIILSPIYSNENIGNISFDIYKKNKKVKTIKFFIRSYNYIVSSDKIERTDTIKIYKQRNCMKNSFIYFPNVGTTTCIKIYTKKEIFFEDCFPSLEKILIDFSKIPKGIYELDYVGEFYKQHKFLVIK